MIKFSCKKCGQNLNVEDKHSGKRIKCPKCGSVGVVPGNSDKIKFNCKNCGQSISVPQIHAGKKGKCPKCKNLVVIPSVKKELSDNTETFSIICSICDETIQVPETSREQTIECPACGSYIEISPGGTMGGFDSSIPPTTDEDSYEEDSGGYKESEGVDKSIIVGISAVAAVLVVVLIVLAVVLRLIVSRPAKRPEALRRQQQVVDADSLPRMVASDTQSTEPVVQERMKENISPTEPISLEGNLENTKIAFVEKINGLNDEIYVMNPDGSEQRNLTNNPAYDRSPSWSPDGKKIAFSRGSEIYVINTDGSGLKNLTNSPDIDSNPSWSPDGKKIAFYSLIRGGNWNRSWMEQNCEIYVMNADGSEKKNLTNNPARDWDPFWSPDGKKIAFRTIAQGNQEIYVMNADGSEQKRLTNHPGNKAISCWSPDGKKILFYTFGDGHYKMIYIVNIDEGESKRLTNSSAEESDPSFSPDGTKIVFVSWRDGNSEIYVMNADGSEQKRLTTDKYPAFPLDVHSPSWSPDGRKIVFCSERGVGQSNIFVMNADGSEQKSLTYGIDLDLEPVWSPFMSSTAKGESKEEDTPLTELVIQEQSPKPDSLGGEPRVRLRQMFLPGKYRLEVIQTMTVKGILTAESSRVKTSESQEKWWYDIDASEPDASGQTTCIATFKRIISSDSEGSSYDTDDPYSLSPYDFEQIIRKIMVNKQYIFKLGQDGSIVSVEGLDRLWDSISNEVSREVAKVDPMNTRRAAQVGRQVVQQLKQEADALGDKGYIKSLFELVYDILPDQPVGVGAVWHKVTSENIPLFGAAEHSDEFTLREIEQNGGTRIAHITCVGSIRQEQSKKTQLGPVSMTINNAHSKRKGEIQLNVDTGLVIRSRDEFDGVMEASMIISGKNVDADAQMSFMTETTTKPVINDSESRESVSETIVKEPAHEDILRTEQIVQESQKQESLFEEPVSLKNKPLRQTRIAFTSGKGKTSDIFIMNADGTELKNLTSNPARDEIPSFSPDGTKIAFTSNRDGERNTEIYVMNADGSEPINLTNNPAKDSYPCWSSTGEKIAFMSLRDRRPEIYIMNTDGSEQTRLTNNTGMDSYPCFSPDGKKVAFTSQRGGEREGEIYVMDADGSEQTRLTNNSARDMYPCFSPDGTKIAFTSYRDGGRNSEIYIMNVDGSRQMRITNNPKWDLTPCWSPDGKKIAFSSNRDQTNEIYIMNTDGSDVKRLTYLPASDPFPSWSPFLALGETTIEEK